MSLRMTRKCRNYCQKVDIILTNKEEWLEPQPIIIIGVIGLGLSLLFGVFHAFMTMVPGIPAALKQAQEMMKIAAWSQFFFGAMIAFGIYNNWRR